MIRAASFSMMSVCTSFHSVHICSSYTPKTIWQLVLGRTAHMQPVDLVLGGHIVSWVWQPWSWECLAAPALQKAFPVNDAWTPSYALLCQFCSAPELIITTGVQAGLIHAALSPSDQILRQRLQNLGTNLMKRQAMCKAIKCNLPR